MEFLNWTVNALLIFMIVVMIGGFFYAVVIAIVTTAKEFKTKDDVLNSLNMDNSSSFDPYTALKVLENENPIEFEKVVKGLEDTLKKDQEGKSHEKG
ncbi:hypothetical protein [Enterococcus rivorum]|uniref:Uncharacterized protein n=1 Tax=Enterococcus rivorum TaxID=762845 RepID=A0A1E5L0J1_9ENTE|nr:hypothetical protein [Enterococcus rivorum]MBP2098878.1 hypothetical protein [Enterococcus rivorum]OEH83605.1 hypothetical protein BCR26_09000 [Enterococcus rivorum]